MMNRDELEEILREKAQERWEASEEPFFLASLQPELSRIGKNYRDALRADEKLSDFARGLSSVKFLQHSQKKAIVGVIPVDEDYDIESHESSSPQTMRLTKPSASKNERVVLEFLRILSALEDADLKEVSLPPHVLAKLLRK